MTKQFDVDIIITSDENSLDAFTLTDLLIEFVELHGWTMGGVVKPFENDDDEVSDEQAEFTDL